MDDYRIIAVDFDGCMCEDRWPEIGAPIEGTIQRLKEERTAGSKLILWTCRTGEQLTAALAWSAEQGITFDAVNDNLPETAQRYGGDARKIFATEYWDDWAVRASFMPGEDADPIHAAGGCYCRECERCLYGHCAPQNFQKVSPNGFCSYGRRKEGADGY